MFYDENIAGYCFSVEANNGDQKSYETMQYYKYSSFRGKWLRR